MGWNDVAKTTEENREKVPYTKFDKGATQIRVLDNEPFSFWSHWLQKQQTSVTCPGKGCPICNIIAQMKANKQQPMYTSSQRHAIRIWNYKTNQMEVMIQSKSFFQQLLVLHEEIGDITTYDIKVVRQGEGKETTYSLLPSAPSDFEITEGIEDVDLNELLSPPTPEEIVQLIEGKTWSEINGKEENGAA